MPTITVIDNEYLKLYYHEDTKIVHHVYETVVPSDLLKEELNAGVELLKKHGAVKWLSDNRHLEGHSEEDSEWINQNWLPNAIAAGWKKLTTIRLIFGCKKPARYGIRFL